MGFFSDLAKGFSKAVTGIPGAIIGGAIDVGSSFLGNELFGKKNAAEAWEQSRANSAEQFAREYGAYKTRYQDTMNDMRAAGLNPILAAGSGGFNVGSGASAQMANAFQAPTPEKYGSSAAQMFASARLNNQKTEESKMNTKKIQAEAYKVLEDRLVSIEERFRVRAQKNLLVAQEKETLQRVKNLKREWWNLLQQFNKITAEATELHSRNLLNQQTAIKTKIMGENIVKQTEKLKAELSQLRKISNVYDSDIGQILGYVKAVMDALPINIGILR